MPEQELYRVWFAQNQIPQYKLVRAGSTDEVYRSFRPAKRAKIVRVDLVVKTSEWDRRRAAGEVPKGNRRRSVRTASA